MAKNADDQQRVAAARAVTRPVADGVRRRSPNFIAPVPAQLLEYPDVDDGGTESDVDEVPRQSKDAFNRAEVIQRDGKTYYKLPPLTPIVTKAGVPTEDDIEPDPVPVTPFEAGEEESLNLDPPIPERNQASTEEAEDAGYFEDEEDDLDVLSSLRGGGDSSMDEVRRVFASSNNSTSSTSRGSSMPRGSVLSELRRGTREPLELEPDNFPDGVTAEPSPALTVPSGTIRNLRAWMSRYRFTQDYDFIRFSRMTPAVYAGTNAKGWLFDAYEVTDESYIANVWGGETLLVEVFQDGRHHPVDSGLLMIGGHPKAYRGSNGDPVLFPTNGNTTSLPGVPKANAGLPPLPGMNFQPDGGPVFPRPELASAHSHHSTVPFAQQLPFGGVGVNELINLADKVAQASAGRNDASVLQQASATSIEAVREMAAAQMAQQQQQMQALLQMKEEQTKPLAATVEVYRQQMEAAERTHRSIAERMAQDHKSAMDHALADHRSQMEAIQRAHELALTSQRQSYETMLAGVRDDARRQETTIRDQWRMERESLDREVNRLREDAVKGEARLRESYDKQLGDLRIGYEKQLSEMRAELNTREQRAMENARMTYEGQILALRQQLDAANALTTTRVEDVRNMAMNNQRSIEDNYKLQLQHRESEIQRLRDDVTRISAELAESRTALSQRSNPLTAVREVAEMTQTFQSLTGTGPTPPAPPEPEPTTLMGQLAKYGPVIGQHVIAPVMKPVQEAVKAAQDDSVRRAEIQRELILMRQQQQQQQEVQAQAQAQMQARLPVQSSVQGTRVIRQADVPVAGTPRRASVSPPPAPPQVWQAQPSRSTAQATPVVEVTTSPATVDVVADSPPTPEQMESNLSQWLETELTNGTPPADVAGQIKLGVQFGQVPAEVVASMTSQEPNEVVKFIQDAARKNNARLLSTPRGAAFVRDILAGLK